MKQIINITKAKPDKPIILDTYCANAMQQQYNAYCKDNLHLTQSYEYISLKHIKALGSDVLSLITPFYLSGIKIIINETNIFQMKHKKERFIYQWVEFNKQHITKSLAEFPVAGSTFLQEISKTKGNYIPPTLWAAMDDYSKARIKKCQEYNKRLFDYSFAEQFYKDLSRTKGFKTFSPNQKTYYEVLAEDSFFKSVPNLEPGEKPLTDKERNFLQTYAKPYDIEVQLFNYRDNYRKTKDGYTIEPERILAQISESEVSRGYYDSVHPGNNTLPRATRQGYQVKSYENEKLLRDSYTHLMWILAQENPDQFLATGWARCPICGELYREFEGCEGHVLPIEQIRADNLLYGISGSYDDYDTEQEALSHTDDYELD